jgi:hypothetical protein
MSTTKPTGGERFEGVVLVLILLIVGGFTAFASFSHVHDWTMTNSPDHTSDWFGWANAVTTELVPTASALVIRRRHRNGQSAKFAMFLLFGFVGLSLTAQLSVARPTPFGYLVSAIPALAFMLLTKLVLSATGKPANQQAAVPTAVTSVPATPAVPAPIVVPTPTPATFVPATVAPVPNPAVVASRITTPRPTAPTAAAVPSPVPGPAAAPASTPTASPAPRQTPPTIDTLVTASGAVQPSLPIVAPGKLARARELAAEYLTEHGTPINVPQLAVRLKVQSDEAASILAALNPANNNARVNGSPVKATR